MEVEVPDWLNVEFMEKVLKKDNKGDKIKVTNMTTKPATAKGDNYTSDMIRVAVEYSRTNSGRTIVEKKSLIVKISPTVEGVKKDMMAKAGVFDIEIKMMETTLTKMNELLSKEGHRLSARVLYTEMGDPSLLVIEDLAPLGFRMADRQAGLDLDHCKIAMRGLAKFHASSVALVEKDPSLKQTFRKGIFHEDYPLEMREFIGGGMKVLAKEVLNWPELDHSYSDKIEKLSEIAYLRAAACARPSNDDFNVINHGDFWVNNMLFRYNDEGKVVDHIFVDFQICVWSSPAVDLLYFLNTSPSLEVSLNHKNALLEEYLDTLRETMSSLGCKTRSPSMSALMKSMKEREFYGVLSAFSILPLVLIDKSEAKSFDEIMQGDGSYDNPAYKGVLFRNEMLRRLPDWNARGLLDV